MDVYVYGSLVHSHEQVCESIYVKLYVTVMYKNTYVKLYEY